MATTTIDTLNLGPDPATIRVTRSDSTPFSLIITDETGAVINITGFTYLLTVDPSEAPLDNTNNLFQLTGVVPVGTDGVVTFSPTTTNLDQTATEYFFDVQQTASGAVRTVAKGSFFILDQITI